MNNFLIKNDLDESTKEIDLELEYLINRIRIEIIYFDRDNLFE
jgi:hypothetical protein